MKIYMTDHVHSKVVCSAVAEGCNGKIVPPTKLLDGPAVVYGILRGCGEIVRQCEWIGRDFYHIDHGYFSRGHYDGYYRVTKNAFQCSGEGQSDGSRFRRLNVPMRPWKRTGKHIVICPISRAFGKFLGIDSEKWTESIVSELSKHTDRPITVKHKDGTPLFGALDDAWCLVTHSSNAAVDAICAGIPSLVTGDSAAWPVGWDFKDIETPRWPEREPWAWVLADNQFTLKEMRSGEVWNYL